MLRIAGAGAEREGAVRVDEYIPLSIEWPRRPGCTLWWMFSGPRTLLQTRFDSDTGELDDLTLVTSGPMAVVEHGPPPAAPHVIPGAPCRCVGVASPRAERLGRRVRGSLRPRSAAGAYGARSRSPPRPHRRRRRGRGDGDGLRPPARRGCRDAIAPVGVRRRLLTRRARAAGRACRALPRAAKNVHAAASPRAGWFSRLIDQLLKRSGS